MPQCIQANPSKSQFRDQRQPKTKVAFQLHPRRCTAVRLGVERGRKWLHHGNTGENIVDRKDQDTVAGAAREGYKVWTRSAGDREMERWTNC